MTWVYVWVGVAVVIGLVLLFLVLKPTGKDWQPIEFLRSFREAFDKQAWQDTPPTSELEIPEVTLTELLEETDHTSS